MLIEQLIATSIVIGVFVTLIFVMSLVLKRNDIADVAWGTGIFVVALVSFLSAPKSDLMLLLTVLAALWGLRLTLRIFLRNRKKGEDFRYRKWRKDWGKWFYVRSFFQVYMLQGFLMIVVGYSFIHASVFGGATSLGALSVFGVLVWATGYLFEVVGDWQLDSFIASKPRKGEILSTGLWNYSRHPNYFGEVVCWWGIWLTTVTLPMSFIALVSPLTITFLILKVSGIPMLEEGFLDNPNFQEYKKRTSAFFPLPPKKM